METNREILPYEPASIQLVVESSSPEETLETPVFQRKTMPENEAELVDFHLTESAQESLKGILIWSKILFCCLIFFILVEIFTLFLTWNTDNFSFFIYLRSAASLAINGYVLWQTRKFNVHMDRALKFNDNPALAEAFGHQELYFKWVFVNMVFTVIYMVLQVFI